MLTSRAQVHLCRCLANEMQSVGCSTSFPGIIDPGDPPCSQPTLLLSLLSSSALPPLLPPRQQTTPPDWMVVSRMGLALWPRSLLFFLQHLSLSFPVSCSFTRAFAWRRVQWRRGEGASCPGQSIGVAWTLSSVSPFLKEPHPTHPLPSPVVSVVAAPSFNEVRLLVFHHIAGWASAGGAVYLQLKVHAAHP